MIRRAERLGSVTREVHFTLANHTPLDAVVTVSALHDPQGHTRGAVIVLEDLSDLIEAQRRAAWSEVARRMAHEIKNPLTPIRLSAERLVKNLLGISEKPVNAKVGAINGQNLTERQTQLIRECTSLITTEVTALQKMVDEFSTYARLPNAKLEPGSLNTVVTDAVRLYQERLDGAQIELALADHLPQVMIDAEQMKRLLVNLIDNALEAMSAQTTLRKITVETRENAARETVELIVSDTGPGIPATDRERVFDPYFSTSKRGTGLGLAIVSHTIIEHQGRIRVNENLPQGARFTIELPLNN
jgi:nitrogen fixation/metabolism regulation signal transduction histidine kinase